MYFYIFESIVFAVCVFAIRCGDREIKIAGGWLLANTTVYWATMLFEQPSPTLSLLNDGIFSVGLLPLAMFFVSWGVGTMTIIQAFSFAVQSYYLLNDLPADNVYLWLTNLACFGVLVTLFGCTLVSLRRARVRARENERRASPSAAVSRPEMKQYSKAS